MAVATISPDDASKFINTRATRYMKVLETLKGIFEEFKFDPASHGAIYSVYSRKDKQAGDEFKEAWKVAHKVNVARTEGFAKKKIPPKPDFPIQDLGDIIGLTVVVVYPSDIEILRRFVRSIEGRMAVSFDEEDKNERGYRAYHYVLGVRDPVHEGIRCEVQIKTILHDAWSAKTHDLTYKPKGALEQRVRDQFEHLSDVLSVIDKQSETLKEQIQEMWLLDEKRKDAAKIALIRGLGTPKIKDPGRQMVYDELVQDVLADEARCREGDAAPILEKLRAFVPPYDLHASRLFTLVAAMRTKDDLDYLALDCIDRWVAGARDDAEERLAYQSKALFVYCLNRLREAIEASSEALNAARRLGNEDLIVSNLLNTAYYFAECAEGPTSSDGIRANELLSEALRKCPQLERLEPGYRDTMGFVKIVTGNNEAAVREGLALCRQAYDESEEKETARPFFVLAERRAFRRLLQFD